MLTKAALVPDADVIARRIADECDAFGVSREVDAVGADQKFSRVVALKQEWMADRAVAVEGFEIEPWVAGVVQRGGVGAGARGRAIGGDVVRGKLAENGPTGGSLAERVRVILIRFALAHATCATQSA